MIIEIEDKSPMSMTEKQARAVSGLLDMLDDLADLRKALLKKDCEFYICAQDNNECLNSNMTLPAESGVIFVEDVAQVIREKLIEYGVIPDPAPISE
jgi:hypothetical protein